MIRVCTCTSSRVAMDELLEECFLQVLKTKVAKTELPLLTSTLYRTHMLPLCPAHLRMDVKKSSHKKVGEWGIQYIQYGSATRYKAFAFHTRAKRARNAFEIFVNAFHSRLPRVSSPFASRSISGY